ncbi:LysR family transcriptional regulator [Streptomyces sp. NPDC090994]|uniref:LysR family transcriptional regulator n=1 Tax=Streptomyces sp. NPDC090994 TaxID=3365969 RepID=UPI00380EC932
MRDVEVRQIQYFVAVAEELNFTRAAERLAMTQPALSRAVRALEKTVGAVLLSRTPQGVTLTAAGEVMLSEGRSLLDRLDDSLARVRRAAGPPAPLTVTSPGCEAALLDRLVREYNGTGPARPVRAEVGTLGDQVRRLRSGRADLALGWGEPEDPELTGVVLRYDCPRVLLGAGHRLAERAALELADLADEPLVDWSGAEDPLRDPGLWPAGPPGRPGPRVSDGLQMMAVVGLGQAAAVTVASESTRTPPGGTVSRPLRDGPRLPLRLRWSRERGTADVREFARYAVRCLRRDTAQ